ncbi:MAG: sigma-54-dependent Fis family transcriptional regulator [Nitrospinota bacterium]|nr:sigma-54-dependent Fis family transcriptional regulator [Nitrospinota bacterium]
MKLVDNQPNIQTLRKISSLFSSADMEIDDLLSMVIDTAVEAVGAKNSSLLLLDEKTKNLQFYQASGRKRNQLKKIDIPSGTGLAGIAAKTGKPIISNDVESDERWFRQVSDQIHFKVTAIATFPLVLNDKVTGVVQFLDKKDGSPFSEKDIVLLEKFAHLMARFFQSAKNKKLLGEEFDRLKEKYMQRYSIVGESDALKKCIYLAEKVANSKAAILLTGESGTGKELFAHLAHESSPRQTKPFISVNCGALPGSILERELFGHEKGAFTGADSRKIGLFEAADSGTLFLDEIGEMPLEMQVKLLRILQDGSFMRLGGTSSIEVDVRIISASNQDLDKLVHEKVFRKDLYYRINVINIKLPSLRERREDIPDLVAFFLKKHHRGKNSPKKIKKSVMKMLIGYPWPGNIRELENVLERAIVLTDSEEIDKDAFEFESYQPPIEVNVGQSLKEANDAFRQTYISNTLKSAAGNHTQAAKVLDVQRSYLSRLIKELKIEE